MRASPIALFVLLSLPATILAKEKEPLKPCTLKSPTTNAFYDLNAISLSPIEEGKHADDKHRNTSYTARGWDYGANFTLNFCAPVVEDLKKVRGLTKEKDRENVGAFYKRDGEVFSIGSVSSEPIFRGRKLVLNYTDGSPCPSTSKSKRDQDGLFPRTILDDYEEYKAAGGKADKGSYKGLKIIDDDDDDEDEDSPSKSKGSTRRKSTIVSFLCQRDPTAAKAAVSFVAAVDECTYMFEVRTPYACEGASSNTSQSGGVGPAGVFGLIVLIAVAAYIIGGVAYQRTVMHQRGWKQLPNYGTWAGMWSFITDCFVIAFSSCSRCLPSRRGGYNQLPVYNDRSRFSRNEDENRLIDQLDEEWDD